ncbi:MAG: hypothetical protein GX195_04355 [Firmicutes bacterium]|nr:hypothetical protein [Bacillota bacterium]
MELPQITHLYNDPAEMLMGKLDGLVDYARRVTGRDDLRMMLTEADHFQIAGAEKRHYLFERQFGLLERADILLGFHHFCLPYFTEGDRTFGLIHRDGAVLDYNYWPYWLMRDLRGTFLPVEVAANQRDITVGPLAAAADVENVVTRTDRLWITVAQDGDVVNAVVYNHGSTSEAVDVTLPVPFAGEGMAIISTVGPVGPGKVEAVPFASETGTFQVSLAVNARNGRAVTLLPLAEATEVWLEMELSKASVLVGQPVEVTVRIVNTSGVEQSGTAFVVGAPTDWPMELLVESNRFTELKPGEVAEFLWRMTPTGASYDEPFALYGFAQHRSPGTRSARAHSIPVHFSSQAPVRFDVLPNLIYVTPGAGGTLEITVQNTFPDQVTGELVVHVPEEDWGQLVETVYSLDVGETKVYEVELVVSEDAEEGSYPLQIDFIYNGVPFSSTVELVVKEFAVGREGTVVYLSGYFDADGFSSEDDFDDLLNFGGPFSLPAAFAPKPGRVEYLGRPFLFPNVADGELNMVRALGQTIPLPEGSYSEMAFLATAVNNSWRGPLVVTYADGSQENLELAVTDWCQEPRWGEIPVYRAPYRHAFGGRLYDAKPQIFLVTLPLNPDLEVTSITLPYLPELLVVALTLMR